MFLYLTFYLDYILLILGFFNDLIYCNSWSDVVRQEMFPLWLLLAVLNILAILASFLWCIMEYLLPAIPLYIMAHNAGYDYPWLVFVPYGKTYVSFALPVREYSYIGLMKTFDRKKVFWIYFALDFFNGIITLVLSLIPFIGGLLQTLYPIAKKLIHYGEYKDVLSTYTQKDTTWISLIGLVLPPVYWIYLFILCRREPEYGYGAYYNPILPNCEDY